MDLSIFRIIISVVSEGLWCLRELCSLHTRYIVVWNASRSSMISILFRWSRFSDVTVLFQSGDADDLRMLAVKEYQIVNVTWQAKNKWSLLSSLSTHNIQPWMMPHFRIRTPVDNLSLKANQTMKACRGTPWRYQRSWYQGTFWPLTLICSQVLTVEKWSLYSSSLCLQRMTSIPKFTSGLWALSFFRT